jgi:hypothetical protein
MPFSGPSPFARYRDIRSAVLLRSKQLEAGWAKEPPLTPCKVSWPSSRDQCSHAVRTTRYTKHYECAVRRAPMDQGHARMRQARWRGTSRQRSSSKPVTLSFVLWTSFPAGHETHRKQTALNQYSMALRGMQETLSWYWSQVDASLPSCTVGAGTNLPSIWTLGPGQRDSDEAWCRVNYSGLLPRAPVISARRQSSRLHAAIWVVDVMQPALRQQPPLVLDLALTLVSVGMQIHFLPNNRQPLESMEH